jgi:hypothetical protein
MKNDITFKDVVKFLIDLEHEAQEKAETELASTILDIIMNLFEIYMALR